MASMGPDPPAKSTGKECSEAARREASPLVVELAGGLFSPLAPQLTNAEVIAALAPTFTFLVAPDRLGVLHDIVQRGDDLRARRDRVRHPQDVMHVRPVAVPLARVRPLGPLQSVDRPRHVF